jgi:hypothetical protein
MSTEVPSQCVFLYSVEIRLMRCFSRLVHLRGGGGNRVRGSGAHRRHKKPQPKQHHHEGNRGDDHDRGYSGSDEAVNLTALINNTARFEIPPPAVPLPDDGPFSALDRLLDNPVVASFAERLFSDKSFQVSTSSAIRSRSLAPHTVFSRLPTHACAPCEPRREYRRV